MPVGTPAHEAAVRRLVSSYAEIPHGAPVRLAKKTSNLFRNRARTRTPGLDVSGLAGVVSIDPAQRTADVQGMCTYEHLVDETLPHGLIPLVVPQLKTITLGGAVTGLGIESTSFRSGLPHESVLEMDVFTGAGEVVTTKPGEPLFEAFPNSYGSLGYATRLRIRLEPIEPLVSLRHIRFDDVALLAKTVERITETREYDDQPVDAMDGTWFSNSEAYLTLARWGGQGTPSDYTGQQIYYRSIQQRATDTLTAHDYLWRWDTDWFWCSGAFGVQRPLVRRLWPDRLKRSDVYHRLVGLDHRLQISTRLDKRAGRPEAERVVQDVEVPVERLAEFMDWFADHVGMDNAWLCPVVAQHDWPTYPLEPGRTYVNVGFWGNVAVGPDAPNAPVNRAIEDKVHELGGHKSLYSTAFYDRETFDELYNGAHLGTVKAAFDPEDRLTSLYDKVVRNR